ncbi:MAG TPA: hypothetical protein VGH76_16000 [Actinomycetospora sp.]|uniref:hypothetical protein n=1 Tax=Actinomycetospora sp. TaxID=1872135 RepID=UPI002F3F5B4A
MTTQRRLGARARRAVESRPDLVVGQTEGTPEQDPLEPGTRTYISRKSRGE